ncbi:Heat-labile enterotoxin IIB, A chain [Metarhizium anisopliae]
MKTSPWALTTTLLLVLGLCQSHPPESGRSTETTLDRRQLGDIDTESPTHVYRGEIGRTPEDVEKDGGFYSRGLQKSQSYGGSSLSDVEMQEGSSLFRHAAGDTAEYTRYVSTSTDPGVSLTFAINDEKPEEKGFVYKIHADKKLVNVNKSLGKYSPYPAQKEHAAVGFIPFEQIEGWWQVTYLDDFSDPKIGKVTQERLRNEKFKAFQKNTKFNKNTFQNQRGAGVAPQLAGFPRLSTAWEEDPWKQFKAQDVQKNLDDLITSACAGKDSCMTQLGHSSKQKGAKVPWTANAADGPDARPAKPKPKPAAVKSGFRVHGRAGTLVGFSILAPYLQDVLRRLRDWDHPIGQTVKLFDDGVNAAQEAIGGPPRNDISGNDNQAALINFFKRVFWALQSVTPGQERPADLALLSYGEKSRRRLDSVNDVLRTCERVDAVPPDEQEQQQQQLGAKVHKTCADLRKRAMEIEAPAAAKLVTGQAACLVCGLAWDVTGSRCLDTTGAVRWPPKPPESYSPETPDASSKCRDATGIIPCGGGQTAAGLRIGRAVCAICGFAWDAEGGKCRNRSGVLVWPLRP